MPRRAAALPDPLRGPRPRRDAGVGSARSALGGPRPRRRSDHPRPKQDGRPARIWALSSGTKEALTARGGASTRAAASRPPPRLRQRLRRAGLDPYGLADALRASLRRAAVLRAALFEKSESRQPIRAHDLRATFVTVSLATGKTEAWVTDRTGHKSSQMVAKYRRAARSVAELGLGGFRRLVDAIPELRELSPPAEDVPPPTDSNVSRPSVAVSSSSDETPGFLSGPSGTRTRDLRIKSPQLYRLSYQPERNVVPTTCALLLTRPFTFCQRGPASRSSSGTKAGFCHGPGDASIAVHRGARLVTRTLAGAAVLRSAVYLGEDALPRTTSWRRAATTTPYRERDERDDGYDELIDEELAKIDASPARPAAAGRAGLRRAHENGTGKNAVPVHGSAHRCARADRRASIHQARLDDDRSARDLRASARSLWRGTLFEPSADAQRRRRPTSMTGPACRELFRGRDD